ncbi:NAD(P)-dependent oxidoreductase [Alkalispirochaeta alkalica]|uniref:NAD(P)-dependent oxidoreductase n=1 Tax=Alkalispirochaeta alkalica TaxID=46356 RepID=UPI0003A5CE7B|nr:NAD(P)-dependent oxidoreductase [Alkalispirochaeta alkalica]
MAAILLARMRHMNRMKEIGWVGTGIMGASMARRILQAGYGLAVYSRTRARAEDLLRDGAVWCETPREVARRSDCVFSIVGYPADVEEVVLGEEGTLAGARDRIAAGEVAPVLVDMTTSRPTLAREIAQVAARQGISSLDAPVSGGDVGAREGTLAIMVGGERDVFERLLPLFGVMGKHIRWMGPAGAGQHTKAINQTLIASTMIGTVEGLLYAERAGLDLEEVIRVVGSGAASSWSVNNLGLRIASGDMAPGFLIRHFVKDLGIALDEAQRLGLALPGLALARQFYQAALAEGLADAGTQALYRVFQRLNSPPGESP